MIRTKALAATLTTAAMLLLGACGSDEPQAAGTTSTAAPTTAAPTTVPTTTAPTTPEPTKSSATPTATTPSGKLISYADGDDTGVTIATAADTARLTGAPADFKTFIAAELATSSTDEGCTEAPQISVDLLDTGGWARGGHFIPQCGGYATLWAKSGGTWKDVWGGQSLVECSTLEQYAFPARVAGDQCLKGDDAVAYTR